MTQITGKMPGPPFSIGTIVPFQAVVDTVVKDLSYLQVGGQAQHPAEMVLMRVGNNQAVEAGYSLSRQIDANVPAAAGGAGIDQDRTATRLMDQQGIALSDIKEGEKDRICRPCRPAGRNGCRKGQEAQEKQAEACVWRHFLGRIGDRFGAKDVFTEKTGSSTGVSESHNGQSNRVTLSWQPFPDSSRQRPGTVTERRENLVDSPEGYCLKGAYALEC